MSKLSSSQIKVLITSWLSDPGIRADLKHHSEPFRASSESEVRAALDEIAERYAAPKGSSQEQLEEHIWRLWCDGSRWKRKEKRQLKEEWETYFSETDWSACAPDWRPGVPLPAKPCFPVDFLGAHDDALVAQYFADPKSAQRCIFRCFVPDNDLSDNYRLEVVTTPEDDRVVGWLVIVD